MIACILSLLAGLQAGGEVELVHKQFGVTDYALFGSQVTGLDDVDLDGVPDYAVAAREEDRNSILEAGSVRVYSGRTHALISELFGTQGDDEFGQRVARLRDVNGDGRGDYALDSNSSFPVRIVSAVDGVILHAIPRPPIVGNYGSALCEIGDLNGDGKNELAIGDSNLDNAHGSQAGIVYLHSGADYSLVATLDGSGANFRYGFAIAAAGDLNGDAIPDFFVGAPGHVRGGRGFAYVHSGADLSVLHVFQGLDLEGGFGSAVDGGSDVDGDGVPDLLAGAPHHDSASVREGQVMVISGASGSLIRLIEAELQQTGFGSDVRFGGDMDGDGRADILVLETNADPVTSSPDPRLLAFSGFDYERLAQFLGDDPATNGYESVFAPLDDVTGDGLGDVLIGFPHERLGTPTRGATYVFSFHPGLFLSGRELSSSAGGSLGAQLRFSAASAGHQYRILASLNGAWPPTTVGGVEVPLVADAAFQSTLAGSFPPFSSGMSGILDGMGRALAAIAPGPGALPPTLIGRTVHLAAVEGAAGVPLRSSVQQGFLIVP